MARKQTSETESIHAEWWDESETITIRRCLSHSMQRAIQRDYADSADRSALNPGDPTSIKIDPMKALDSLETARLRWMVSWTLKDTQGELLPLNQASIDSLAEEDIDFIDAEIGKRSQGMTEAQEEAFLLPQFVGTGG